MVEYIHKIIKEWDYIDFEGRIDFGRNLCSFEVAMEGALSMVEQR
jgi:hypothetical protein